MSSIQSIFSDYSEMHESRGLCNDRCRDLSVEFGSFNSTFSVFLGVFLFWNVNIGALSATWGAWIIYWTKFLRLTRRISSYLFACRLFSEVCIEFLSELFSTDLSSVTSNDETELLILSVKFEISFKPIKKQPLSSFRLKHQPFDWKRVCKLMWVRAKQSSVVLLTSFRIASLP
jgi:hypothetical protein